MALIDYEHANRETNANLSNWFNQSDATIRADGTGPFGYGRAIFTNNTWRNLPANYQTLWVNLHFLQAGIAAAGNFFMFRDGGTDQIGIGLSVLNEIVVTRGSTIVASSAPNVWAANAWYFLQCRIHVADAGGRIEVWLQGQKIIDFTGDTKQTANAYVNQWRMSRNNNLTDIANVIIFDETGAAPNARTAETRIFADLPTGAGAAAGWVPSAGANWQCVDEQPNDGDTTRVTAAAAGVDDLYAYSAVSIPGGATVFAVAAEIVARKDDAGVNEIDTLARSGGTTYPHGSAFSLTSSYQRLRTIWTTDPDTGAAWTAAAANSSEIGVRRIT